VPVVLVVAVHLDLGRFKGLSRLQITICPHIVVAELPVFPGSSLPVPFSLSSPVPDRCININRFAIVASNSSTPSTVSGKRKQEKRKRERERGSA